MMNNVARTESPPYRGLVIGASRKNVTTLPLTLRKRISTEDVAFNLASLWAGISSLEGKR